MAADGCVVQHPHTIIMLSSRHHHAIITASSCHHTIIVLLPCYHCAIIALSSSYHHAAIVLSCYHCSVVFCVCVRCVRIDGDAPVAMIVSVSLCGGVCACAQIHSHGRMRTRVQIRHVQGAACSVQIGGHPIVQGFSSWPQSVRYAYAMRMGKEPCICEWW